ncbi:MAG TPA: ATPase, T2SS/T4P/T4SS family [Paenalcaligenes sp.]|nr:ATPase, T2SS/T4P/T4SS family [Paenalcaligenes sp.]
MRNDYQRFSGWWRGRKRYPWVFHGPSAITSYGKPLDIDALGETRHCDNLEQIKALEPALRYGLQEQLRLNDQLLRDVLPVMCADGRVVLLVTDEAIHSDAVRSLSHKLLEHGHTFGQYAYLVVDVAVLLAVRRTLPTRERDDSSSGIEAVSNTRSEAELYAMFVELVRWGVHNEASDLHINLHLDATLSPVYYTVAGRYVQPSVFKSMQTDLLRDMLAVAWMGVQGGNAPVFDVYQEQQGRLECNIGDQTVRLRWASLAAVDGPSVCLRILGQEKSADYELSDLGYFPEQQRLLLKAALSERGAIVFSGSVGSGKSTALATLVRHLPAWRKVITLEDPVEYRIPRAIQVSLARELDEDTHQHFAAKLRALKRSAMTDVLLGEIRDAETAQAFTDLATSGVRVFTTVHAARARLVPQRLSSSFIGVDPQLLETPGVLRLLVHQELLPQLCQHCALSVQDLDDYPNGVPAALYQFRAFSSWRRQLQHLWGKGFEHLRVRNPDGCAACADWSARGLAGFSGRTVVAELLQPHNEEAQQPCIYSAAWRKLQKGILDPFEVEHCFGLFDSLPWQKLRQQMATKEPKSARMMSLPELMKGGG